MGKNWILTHVMASHMMTKIIGIILVLGTLGNCQVNNGAAKYTTNKLIDLNEDNWQLMLKGEWMVEFYAPWCPACKNLASTWQSYADTASNINVKVAKIDVTTSPSLSGRFFVTALPTIYHVINGDFRQYRGSRDLDALSMFIRLKQWQKIDPVSAWKKPDTIHMSILSQFFKLSHFLKDLNTHLQEEYGLPTWGSYALFAFSTIFVGATLGLVLVCIVDALYPPKAAPRQTFSETKERNANEVIEDLAHDELEDENAPDEDSESADEVEDVEQDKEVASESQNEDDDVDAEPEENEAADNKEKMAHNSTAQNVEVTNLAQKNSSPGEVRKRKPRKD